MLVVIWGGVTIRQIRAKASYLTRCLSCWFILHGSTINIVGENSTSANRLRNRVRGIKR